MDSEDIYENVERRDIEDTFGPRTQNHSQDEGKDGKRRGSRCLVLMTVCLGLMCVLLLVFITLQYITITAERDLLKNTVEEFKLTINSLSQKKLELESKVTDLSEELKKETFKQVSDLTAEKSQLQRHFDSVNQKKLELEAELRKLSERGNDTFFISCERMNWSKSRQFCRDQGADLIIINTEEKQRFITSLVKESVWIGLSDTETEGTMKWVDNSTLKQGFWYKGEPNNIGNEDCIELDPTKDRVKNWNDLPCSYTRKWICEK